MSLISNLFHPRAEAMVFAADPSLLALGNELQRKVQRVFGRCLAIRALDSGSCNACEGELAALGNPYYDVERFGLKFVASPKHADILLVTGCVTRNLLEAMLEAYQNMPDPKWVISVGNCALDNGVFKNSYAVEGPVSRHLPVALHIPGCPPDPRQLINGLHHFMTSLHR
jgi:membrane-bound hydrogenase subunit mbhJ